MKAKKFNFKNVLKFTQRYMHRRGQALLRYLYPFKTKRGRPRKYQDEIILVLLFIQVAWKLSFRDLEHLAVQIFGRDNIPDFSTYYYRLQKLPPYLLIDFLNFISRRLLGKYHSQVKFLIIDGTGFKYYDLYPLKILRGLDIRSEPHSFYKFNETDTVISLISKKRFSPQNSSYKPSVTEPVNYSLSSFNL